MAKHLNYMKGFEMDKKQIQEMNKEDFKYLFSDDFWKSIDWNPALIYNVNIYDVLLMNFMGDI